MREFIILGHSATISPDFSLDDLTGNTGRLDVLCRCVNSAFFLSHAFRHSVTVYLVLQDSVTIRFAGDSLRHLHPDERNIAAAIRGALDVTEDAIGHQEASSNPGIFTANYGLQTLLENFDSDRFVVLTENGTPLPNASLPPEPVFLLSDHQDYAPTETTIFTDHNALSVKVGPHPLHADHTITIVHNYLDTNGYQDYS